MRRLSDAERRQSHKQARQMILEGKSAQEIVQLTGFTVSWVSLRRAEVLAEMSEDDEPRVPPQAAEPGLVIARDRERWVLYYDWYRRTHKDCPEFNSWRPFAAWRTGVSENRIKACYSVLAHGIPALVQRVERREIALKTAWAISKLPKDQQGAALAGTRVERNVPYDEDILDHLNRLLRVMESWEQWRGEKVVSQNQHPVQEEHRREVLRLAAAVRHRVASWLDSIERRLQ